MLRPAIENVSQVNNRKETEGRRLVFTKTYTAGKKSDSIYLVLLDPGVF